MRVVSSFEMEYVRSYFNFLTKVNREKHFILSLSKDVFYGRQQI